MNKGAQLQAREGLFSKVSRVKPARPVVAAVTLCILLTPANVFAPVAGLAAAAAAALPDPLGLFASRSTGARSAGALAATKPERVAPGERGRVGPPVRAAGPHERVLPQIRTRAPGGGGIPETGEMDLFPPDLPMTGLVPMDRFTTLPPGGPDVSGPTPPPLIPIMIVVPNRPSPPPISVPEPASWVTLMLGFGGLGTLLRVRRRAAAGATPHR